MIDTFCFEQKEWRVIAGFLAPWPFVALEFFYFAMKHKMMQAPQNLEEQLRAFARKIDATRTEMVETKQLVTQLASQELTAKLNQLALQHLRTRHMVSQYEAEAMTFIFEGCRSEPYHMRSLKNLSAFLDNPQTAKAQGRCGRKAPEAFAALSEDQKNQIQARLVSVLDLLDLPAIADLKKAQALCPLDELRKTQPWFSQDLESKQKFTQNSV